MQHYRSARLPTYRSFAKLNLHLEVLGRRADGYHELRTLFQTVGLYDELVIERLETPGIELEVSGPWIVPSGSENLCFRAARAFLDFWGEPEDGVRIELAKSIPPGSGLGGGSSNAAAVLLAMAELWNKPRSLRELRPLANELGADVPFFLVGGTAFATGRGDRIEPLPDPPIRWEAWVLWPGWSLSTREVFARWRPRRNPVGARYPALERLLEQGTWTGSPADWLGWNDLEACAFELAPELARLYTELVQGRARAVRMSGSGSALFALFDDEAAAKAMEGSLPKGVFWRRTQALGRVDWREASGWALLSGEEETWRLPAFE